MKVYYEFSSEDKHFFKLTFWFKEFNLEFKYYVEKITHPSTECGIFTLLSYSFDEKITRTYQFYDPSKFMTRPFILDLDKDDLLRFSCMVENSKVRKFLLGDKLIKTQYTISFDIIVDILTNSIRSIVICDGYYGTSCNRNYHKTKKSWYLKNIINLVQSRKSFKWPVEDKIINVIGNIDKETIIKLLDEFDDSKIFRFKLANMLINQEKFSN